MPEPLTIRRQMIETLMSGLYSARDLAHLYAIPERQVEDHLTHIVRSLEHDPARRFLMEPAECGDCGYRFRERSRLTKPGRCPRCRQERISSPRFSVHLRPS